MPKSINLVDRIFYVYALFRPNGVVCYIGKGVGDRIDRHERFARRDANSNKHLLNIIRNAGGTIPKVIIRDGLLEAEAFVLESIFIRAIGLERDGGPLINLTYGGEGPSGLVFSDETLQVLSEKSLAIWSDPGKREEQSRRQKAIWSTEERREKQNVALQEMWGDPQVRARHKESLRNYWEDESSRAKHSEYIKQARKADPTIRTRIGNSVRRTFANRTEEQLAQASDHARRNSARLWADPVARAKMVGSMKWWHTPEGVPYRAAAPLNENDLSGRGAVVPSGMTKRQRQRWKRERKEDSKLI